MKKIIVLSILLSLTTIAESVPISPGTYQIRNTVTKKLDGWITISTTYSREFTTYPRGCAKGLCWIRKILTIKDANGTTKYNLYYYLRYPEKVNFRMIKPGSFYRYKDTSTCQSFMPFIVSFYDVGGRMIDFTVLDDLDMLISKTIEIRYTPLLNAKYAHIGRLMDNQTASSPTCSTTNNFYSIQ